MNNIDILYINNSKIDNRLDRNNIGFSLYVSESICYKHADTTHGRLLPATFIDNLKIRIILLSNVRRQVDG